MATIFVATSVVVFVSSNSKEPSSGDGASYGDSHWAHKPNTSTPLRLGLYSLTSLLGSLRISIFWSQCLWAMHPWSSSDNTAGSLRFCSASDTSSDGTFKQSFNFLVNWAVLDLVSIGFLAMYGVLTLKDERPSGVVAQTLQPKKVMQGKS